eukprot:MONOS_1853.1-p1 / transcript=MONOS_1853.1 / gene=MONOS_1853 / organism=Monocercomonoides_exilis_PA203 / gene_product=unspecified product / transcript_product=unspecified product / location=Mono_scaffold00035:40037-40657(-) / protein_length=207 / sequence_SO=supercontig / SO=protein_coding / is_pseudo=false
MELDQYELCEDALVCSMEDLKEAEAESNRNALKVELCRFAVKWVFVHLFRNGIRFIGGKVAYSERFNHLLLQALQKKIVRVKELNVECDFEGAEEGVECLYVFLLEKKRYSHLVSFGQEGIRCISSYLERLFLMNRRKAIKKASAMAIELNKMESGVPNSRKEIALLIKEYLEEEGFGDESVVIGSAIRPYFVWDFENRLALFTFL